MVAWGLLFLAYCVGALYIGAEGKLLSPFLSFFRVFLLPCAAAGAQGGQQGVRATHARGQVAVVDADTSKMVANLSNSDVRVLLATEEVHYDFFSLTALQVVQVSRRMLPHHPTPEDAKAFPAVVTAHPHTPVKEVIERLAATRECLPSYV